MRDVCKLNNYKDFFNCRVTSSENNFDKKKDVYLLYAMCKEYNVRLPAYLIMLQNRELQPIVGHRKH